jgi:PQQ-like domain
VYAFYTNGTLKWRFQTGNWVHASPTIGPDGTIYLGTWQMNFYAIRPNGTIKWTYNAPGRIWFGSSASVSSDGTIFFGTTTQDGGSGVLVALNPDGTERFKNYYGFYATSPAIGEDGTVYAASFNYVDDNGQLHAFGQIDSNAPTAPTITGQANGKIKKTYTYTFTSTSPLGNNISYLVDWGDGTTTDWLGPYTSGKTLTLNHSWAKKGTYSIKARAKDTHNNWGPWGELKVTMPSSYTILNHPLIDWLCERFPHAFPILRYILNQCKTFFS